MIHLFNPERFDPEKWLDLAQEAGMQYICFTTKHHDGFCMWDTEHTEYNIMNTPYGKDILGMLSEACAKRVTLLNDGRELEAHVDVTPWHWKEKPLLRIRNIPVNEMSDTVMIIRLEFDESVSE